MTTGTDARAKAGTNGPLQDSKGDCKPCCKGLEMLIERGFVNTFMTFNREDGITRWWARMGGPRSKKRAMVVNFCPCCGRWVRPDEPEPAKVK